MPRLLSKITSLIANRYETTIPESTLHDWAAGNRVIPHKERQILADLLGCDAALLAPNRSSSLLPATPLEEEKGNLESESSNAAPPPEGSPHLSQTLAQDTIEVPASKPGDENGTNGLPATDRDSMQQPPAARTQQERTDIFVSPEQRELLLALARGDDTMLFDASKREALRAIAATFLTASHSEALGSFATSDPEPWERLLMARRGSSPATTLNATTLEHFEQLLTISWRLCDGNQLASAEGVLGSFLPQLLSLPRHESGTASLVSNGLRLQSIFAHHHLRLNDKVHLCEQAVNFARQAEDANTLVTALIELAWAYKYAKQPEECWMPLQEALDQCRQASPLVQARAYSEYSLALAENGRIRKAEFYIGLAQEVFPNDPAKDPAFAFADSNMFDISYCAGFVCIHGGSIEQAFSAFERYKQHPSGLVIPERHRLIIVNGQSQAAILANDAERYAGLLEDVLVGSMRIESQKRFDEALALFREDMPVSWLSVGRIKQLVEKYGLERAG